MAIQYLSTDAAGQSVTNGDELVVLDGVNITASSTGVILSSGASQTDLVNFGTIVGSVGVDVNATTSVITNYGTIHALSTDGIDIAGADANHTILNHGIITSMSYLVDTISLSGASAVTLINTGEMRSIEGNSILYDDSALSNVVVENSGLLSGGELGMSGSGTTSLVNTGTIYSSQIDARSAGATTIYNSGFIGGQGGQATSINTSGIADTVTNSGTMHAGVNLYGGNDTFINTGMITGNLNMGNDADTFDGRGGTITGSVIGGTGDDTYIIDDATITLLEYSGQGTDTVETAVSYALEDNFENLEMIGGEDINAAGNDLDNVMDGNIGSNSLYGRDGDDVISGGDGNDMIKGGAGDDTLNGDDGNDILYGGTDNDRLFGGGGNDILEGRRGVDRLYGGDGDDFVDGAAGNDLLNGGDGDDIIDGGEGLDKMYGGDGSDTFIWHSASESKDSGKADQIYDFETGVDQLDFVDIMSGDFDLNIGGSLTGGGTASIMTVETGGDTEIFADVDGDGVADMRVDLVATLGVTEVDFIL